MQQKQPYIEAGNCYGHTVDAANIGGTDAANDCVLWFTTHVARGVGVAQIGTAATGAIWQITRRGIYRLDVYCDVTGHVDTDLTALVTLNADAAALAATPTNATTGAWTRVLRKVLPSATGITETWHFGATIDVNDFAAHQTNVGSANPGALIRVILAGAVADTHPTANVVGTAANWGYRIDRVGDRMA